MTDESELFPEPNNPSQGAFVVPEGGVRWCAWAPEATVVTLVLGETSDEVSVPMESCGNGFFEHFDPQAGVGTRYAYRLDDGPPRPDPATRWQPDGVNAFSAVFDPGDYQWNDSDWRGVSRYDLVVYELHVGTFTEEGTFDAVIPRLKELKELGVTAIEIMPVSQFSGSRNWGYDGVHPFAAQNTYGGPQGLQRLIDAAHSQGVGVILDVVYNHLGPEGNYLPEFGPYFTDRYHTPWGKALNYDGPDCDPVRRYVCDNARMWVRNFHIDGLRLDAIQTIYDFSARHILSEIREAAHEEAAEQGRPVHVIGETNQNDARLTARPEQGGIGLDGVWSDDLHHTIHSLLTGEREGYYRDFGDPQHLTKALNDTFVYDGKYSPFRRRRFGSSVTGQDRTRFVVCIQNHDQVGNRALGERLDSLVEPAQRRLAAVLLLLSPGVPLLFMGEEYGETHPFPFFCSFSNPDLIEAVREGRRREFAELEFQWGQSIPDPQAEETFLQARLSWNWEDELTRAGLRRLYADLLAARCKWPALIDREHVSAQLIGIPEGASKTPVRPETAGSESGPDDFHAVLKICRGGDSPIIAFANLSPATIALSSVSGDVSHDVLLASEDARYGGDRTAEQIPREILPYEAAIVRAVSQ